MRDSAREASVAILRRRIQHLAGRTLFDYQAIIHKNDAIGDLAGKANLLGYNGPAPPRLRASMSTAPGQVLVLEFCF